MPVTQISSYVNAIMKNYGDIIVQGFTQYGPGNQLIGKNSILGWLMDSNLAGGNRVKIGLDHISQDKVREWPVHSATVTATSYTPSTDPFPVASQETLNLASISPKAIGIPLQMDNLSRAMQRGANFTGSQNMLAWEVEKKLKALIAALETQLRGDGTGNSSKDFDGMRSFLKTTGNYAGIAQTNSYWQPSVQTSTGAITLAKFRTTKRALEDRAGFTDVLCSPANFDKFRELYEPTGNTNINAYPGNIGTPMIDTIIVDGYPVRKIQGMIDTEVWFLNRPDLCLELIPQDFSDEAGEVEHTTQENIPVGIRQESVGKDVTSLFFCTYGNHVCENPRNQGAMIGVT